MTKYVINVLKERLSKNTRRTAFNAGCARAIAGVGMFTPRAMVALKRFLKFCIFGLCKAMDRADFVTLCSHVVWSWVWHTSCVRHTNFATPAPDGLLTRAERVRINALAL